MVRATILTVVILLFECSPSESSNSKTSELSDVESFYLSAHIVGPENDPDRLCPSGVQIEIDSMGVGSVFWNKVGVAGHHGCFYLPEEAVQKDNVSLDAEQFEVFKSKIRRIEWSEKFEKLENAGFNPHADCEIHHNSLPDTRLVIEKNNLVSVHAIYIYELEGDYVGAACKKAIKRESDIVQEIIDFMPVEAPFSSKLYYISKHAKSYKISP